MIKASRHISLQYCISLTSHVSTVKNKSKIIYILKILRLFMDIIFYIVHFIKLSQDNGISEVFSNSA
jgi:hypothetical protein